MILKSCIILNLSIGMVIHGPSGSGKSNLARWIAYKYSKQYKFISVACADLVHKVIKKQSY